MPGKELKQAKRTIHIDPRNFSKKIKTDSHKLSVNLCHT